MKRLLLALALCLLFGASTEVRSQTSRVPHTLAGDWHASLPFSQARAVAMRAFDARLSSVPAIMRGLVRNRIESRMHPPRRITIELIHNRIRVTNYGRRRVVIDTPLGESTRIRGDDGEERRVTQRLRHGWLEQHFEGEDGSVRRLLSTEADGNTLHTDITLENERLDGSVRWRLDFHR